MAIKTKAELLAKLNLLVKNNGNEEITGDILNDVLQDFKDSLTVFGLEEYNSSITYPEGAGCLRNGELIIALETATGTFDPAKWKSSKVVPITRDELYSLYGSGTMKEGYYKITDRADGGVFIKANSATQIDVFGSGVFLNPDYQSAGDYSGVTGFGTQLGVWRDTLTPSVNDIVIWNGAHYKNLTGAVGTAPSGDVTNWVVLAKTLTNGYIQVTDEIGYNLISDRIYRRFDVLGNEHYNDGVLDGIACFQWGNTGVKSVKCQSGSKIDCLNNSSTISKLMIAVSLDINMNDEAIDSKTIISGMSNFTADLDMSDTAVFDSGVLTIPDSLSHVGVFTLINNGGQTIEQIVGLPTNHKSRFYVAEGNTQSFAHVSISGASDDELVCDSGASTYSIVGRADNKNDFIEYEKAGPLNRINNIVKLS